MMQVRNDWVEMLEMVTVLHRLSADVLRFLKVMGFIKGVKADLFLALDERKLPTLALKNVMTMVSYGARQRCKTEILPLAIKNTLSIDGRKTVLLCHFGSSRCSLWFWKTFVRCCRCRLHP